MNQPTYREYYSELRNSANELLELGLDVIPAMEKIFEQDDYTGFAEFQSWRSTCEWDDSDPNQFGVEGLEVCGRWNDDASEFHGFFPIRIGSDGEHWVSGDWHGAKAESLHEQIDIAEEYRLPLGIAARANSLRNLLDQDIQAVNSLVYADQQTIGRLAGHNNLRIEALGRVAWTYANIDWLSDELGLVLHKDEECISFGIDGVIRPLGEIVRSGCTPCYPSFIQGQQVRVLNLSKRSTLLTIPSFIGEKISFDVVEDEQEYDECDEYDESIEEEAEKENADYWEDFDESDEFNWCHNPDEDERLFQESVNKHEESVKIDKSIIRRGTRDSLQNPNQADVNTSEMGGCQARTDEKWLDQLFPHDLADACRCLTRNLPYDEITVSVAYLAGIASLLKLGTKINGNPLTKFEVPPNLYLAFVGKSGAKKTPLKGILVDDPAHPIQLELSSQYTRQLRKWEEDCRGIKENDKPLKPIPLKIRTQDYTAEALVNALQKADEHGRSFGIFRDELNGMFKNMNRHANGRGGDEEQLLELFDGKPFDSSRVTNSRSYERCSVTVYGNLQPRIFADLTKEPDATGQWARFLFVPLPAKTVPLPVECTEEERREVEVATKVLEDYAVRAFELSPRVYILDRDARRLFSEYEHEKQKGVHSSVGETQSALHGKSAGKVLRIAGLKHILSIVNAKSRNPESIGVDVLKTAMALVDACDHWALSQYTNRGVTNSRITKEMRRLHALAWKLKKTVTWTQMKDCLSSKETQSMDRMKAEDIFRQLESMGYGDVSFGSRGGLCYRALKPLPFE